MDHKYIRAEALISFMSERRLLWDKTCESYRDITMKQSAWNEVYRGLRPGFDSLTRAERENFGKIVYSRWANLRHAYFRAEKKEKEAKRHGKSHKPYIYKNQLRFLSESKRSKRNSSDSDGEIEEIDIVVKKEAEDSSNIEDSSSVNSAAGPSTPVSEENPLAHNRSRSHFSRPDRRMCNPIYINDTKEENHHLLFFRSILPSIEQFDEDETLELHANILAVVQQIRKKRRDNR